MSTAEHPVLIRLTVDLADLVGRLVPDWVSTDGPVHEATDLLRRAWEAGISEGERQERERAQEQTIAWFEEDSE